VWPLPPAVQSALVPLAAGFALAGLLRLVGGPDRGRALASAAVGLALVAGLLTLLGWPVWPPRTVAQKLPYLVAAGSVLGVVLDARPLPRAMALLVALAWPAVVLGWLAWPRLAAPSLGGLAPVAAAYAGGAFALVRLQHWRGHETVTPTLLLAASLGLAGLAVLASARSLGQLAGVLAGAVGGFLLWNWPVARFPFGWGGLLPAGGALVALAGQALLFTRVSPLALGLLLTVFLADRVAPPGGSTGRGRRVLAPVLLAAVAAVPVVAALALACYAGQAESPYYR
jgi:hypothetical protein